MAKKYYMVKQKIFVRVAAGCDILKDIEYSGMIHTCKKDAEAELKKAMKDVYRGSIVKEAFIEEIENG